MTNIEKVQAVSLLIAPEVANTDLLELLIAQAESIILNRRYPYGIPENATVPARYDQVQIRIAVELYSKMGAEGQTAHNENGINRTWESADVSPSLLKQITPLCGSVM